MGKVETKYMAGLKRGLIIALLVIAGLGALLCVFALYAMGPSFGGNMLMPTAMGVGYLLAISFGALIAVDRPVFRWVAFAGMALSGLLVLTFPVFMWWTSLRRGYGPFPEPLGELTGSGMVIAGFLCLSAMVVAPRMNFIGRLIQLATALSMIATTGAFLVLIWASYTTSRGFDEYLAIFLVLTAAGMLATFATHRFLGIKTADVLSAVEGSITLKCPRCQKEQELPLGRESACSVCKLRITVEVEEPRCPKCGYNLHQLTRPICPECGEQLSPQLAPLAEPATPAPVGASAT